MHRRKLGRHGLEVSALGYMGNSEFYGTHDRAQSMSTPRGDNFARNIERVAAVETIATEKGCTAAQLALAWVLARGSDVVPIPGTRSCERLDQNAAATALALSADDLERIEGAVPADTVAGTRYREGGMAALEG